MDWPLQRHGDAGRSAEREYRRLRRAWEKRVFGRAVRLFWPLLALLIAGSTLLPKPESTITIVGLCLVGIGWMEIRESLTPDHIRRWERGAWGEREVAKRLKPLASEGWVVRHDLTVQGSSSNRDHVVAGPGGLYLLDTKFHPQDEITLEGDALRVRRIDQPRDSSLLDRLPSRMRGAAAALSAEVRGATGVAVFVHPVVVVYGRFAPPVQEAGGVFYLEGDALADWLRNRPAGLHGARRETVLTWLADCGQRA